MTVVKSERRIPNDERSPKSEIPKTPACFCRKQETCGFSPTVSYSSRRHRERNSVPIRNQDSPSPALSRLGSWSLPTNCTAGHRGCIVCMRRPPLCCPEGTSEYSPAFQRWVGREKVPSPEGTVEQARGK